MLPIHDPSGNGNYVWADGSNPNYTSWANPPPKGSCAFTFVQGQNVWIPSACEVDGVPINIICQYTPN
uniref:C-type lectin domain-containing protein n=1 Tax=Acrobeloides nanus TaxID=290746 RepID=A0A914DTD7_9BILA